MPKRSAREPRGAGVRKAPYRIPLIVHDLSPNFPSPIIPPRERLTEPKVRREVEACRRRALNQAIGRLTGMSMNAVDGIANLAKEADSESVQLRAWRAIWPT